MEEKVQIPDEWVTCVREILFEGDLCKIDWTDSAFKTWQAATLSAFHYEAHEAMANALSLPGVMGVKVFLPEPGVSYAFWFMHNRIKLYGKICLRPNKLNIKIISAHTPRKGDELF